MDIRQLRYFVQIVDLKSFSRAAEVLHVAQPALGTQIRKLEDELQVELLVRHSRGVEPTPAGILLKERATEILHHLDDAKRAVQALSGPARHIINFGVTPSTNPSLVIDIIRLISIEMPNTQLIIHEAMNNTLLEWLKAGVVDLALIYLAGNQSNEFTIDDLMEEDAVFVQRRSAETSESSTIPLTEVCQQPLVMPSKPHHLRGLLQSAADRAGLKLDIVYEMQSLGTTLEMVEREIVSTVLPFGAVARHVATGRLSARTVTEPRLPLTLSIVRSSSRTISRSDILLRRFLTQLIL